MHKATPQCLSFFNARMWTYHLILQTTVHSSLLLTIAANHKLNEDQLFPLNLFLKITFGAWQQNEASCEERIALDIIK